MALVLLAAILHASWNALVKTGGDPMVRLAVMNAIGSLLGLVLVSFTAPPAPEAWPFLFGSILVHSLYYLFLILGYRFGDLSLVYPVARGVAPVLVAVGGFLFAGETLSLGGMFAVGVISVGILSITLSGGRRIEVGSPVVYALLTGVAISSYTILDGLGGRLSGNVPGYIAWLFFLDGIPLVLVAAWLRGGEFKNSLRTHWKPSVIGGVFSMGAYALVIWAMSLTPMTYVSALRETSVLIAALIGTKLLGEPLGGRRVAAAALVAAGVVVLQLSKAA